MILIVQVLKKIEIIGYRLLVSMKQLNEIHYFYI